MKFQRQQKTFFFIYNNLFRENYKPSLSATYDSTASSNFGLDLSRRTVVEVCFDRVSDVSFQFNFKIAWNWLHEP